MQPRIELLSSGLISRILDEAFQLMMNPGIKVLSPRARILLASGGAHVDGESPVVRIPEKVGRAALESVPSVFDLFDRLGRPTVTYGGNTVQFDPGSCAVHVLDPDTCEHRPAKTPDLVRIVKVAEMLPQYDAQSTAVVCDDVPKAIGDLYRLYVVLLYSLKPIVTGAFSNSTLQAMFEMLALFAGGRQGLADRPQAVFDVCPSPPLIWSEFGAENSDFSGRGPDAGGNRVYAFGRSSLAGDALGDDHATCSRMPQRNNYPPARPTGLADRLGRRAGDF